MGTRAREIVIHHVHSPVLVILSVLIAIFGSYTALGLANSVTMAQGRARIAWLAGGSIAMGTGIWSMHFVAMLALHLPGLHIAYNVLTLILSISVAILASAIALYIVSHKHLRSVSYVLGSLFMGAAICGMHYIGIAAMSMPAIYKWNYALVAASIAIAVCSAFLSLLLAFRFRHEFFQRGLFNRIAGGVAMGLAISGMHYTAMAAMTFYPGAPLSLDGRYLIATNELAAAVIGTTASILALVTITGSVVERALERRKAAAEEIVQILESITDGFYSVDRKWRLIYINTVAKRDISHLSEIEIGNLQGQILWQIFPKILNTKFEKEFRRAMNENVQLHVEDFFHPMGRWFECRVYPSVRGLSVYFRDVTDRKETEHALRALVEKLQTEQTLREGFVASLSHDLRNPLTAAKSTAQILLRLPEKTQKQERALYRIVDTIDRADKMIQNLLDVNRLQAGERLPLKLEPCDLRTIVEAVAEELSFIFGSRFQLNLKGPISGYWDRDALARVVENLVNNAAKYGAPESPITISLLENSQGVILSVHNRGIPLSSDEQKLIFEPFKRAQLGLTSGKVGWGLGLAIIRGIVEAHGGTIFVTSVVEDGTTFTVNLPLDSRPFQSSEKNETKVA